MEIVNLWEELQYIRITHIITGLAYYDDGPVLSYHYRNNPYLMSDMHIVHVFNHEQDVSA